MKLKIILFLVLCLIIFSETLNAQWKACSSGLYADDLTSLISNGNYIFAGNSEGVFLSTNNGDNWNLISVKLFNFSVNCLAINGNDLIVGGNGSRTLIYASDNLNNWNIKDSVKIQGVLSITVNQSNIIVGSESKGIYISKDKCNSWSEKNSGLSGLYRQMITALITKDNNIYAGTWRDGVYFSSDNGENWLPKNSGIEDKYVTSIAISGENIFIGTMNSGIYHSTDNGNTWIKKYNGLSNDSIRSLAVYGKNIFAGTMKGIYLSTNNGELWTFQNSGFNPTIITALLLKDDYIFASTYNNQIFRAKLSNFNLTNIDDKISNSNFISPNPASDYIEIRQPSEGFKPSEGYNIQIFNIIGEKVEQTFLSVQTGQTGMSDPLKIDISNLPSGVYFIRIGDKFEKFVKI